MKHGINQILLIRIWLIFFILIRLIKQDYVEVYLNRNEFADNC